MKYIVGKIQGYPVIYIPERDIVFCKNTAVPFSTISEKVLSSNVRENIPDKNLSITKDKGIIKMGCISTTRTNLLLIKEIIKNINNGDNTYPVYKECTEEEN